LTGVQEGLYCGNQNYFESWKVSRSYYVASVGKIVSAPDTLRDKLGGLGLQDLALRAGCVRVSFHRILQNLKQHEYIVASVLDSLEHVCGREHLGRCDEDALQSRIRRRHSFISCRCLSAAFGEAEYEGLDSSTSRGVHAS
jgi:hypothetical protein